MTERVIVGEKDVPRLAPHVRLNFDDRRQQWVVLAPERVIIPDEIAVEVLRHCTGAVSLGAVIDTLVGEYSAPREEIARDVIDLVEDLIVRGVLRT
ncbi:MAG: pyrroloquinoline quinone biosynthesis peptide chaperone PqqD [Hyphomicrobiales bacterium]|nr:pyrroloquinoline quinone biosynthesis peptide chaperone PqqD [Hyphomicrobiales bacterium]